MVHSRGEQQQREKRARQAHGLGPYLLCSHPKLRQSAQERPPRQERAGSDPRRRVRPLQRAGASSHSGIPFYQTVHDRPRRLRQRPPRHSPGARDADPSLHPRQLRQPREHHRPSASPRRPRAHSPRRPARPRRRDPRYYRRRQRAPDRALRAWLRPPAHLPTEC